MQQSTRTSLFLAASFAGALATNFTLGGCVTRTQPLAGYSSDEVWIAMQAVADSPSYDDWHIVQNDVYANDASRSIEIYRELRRLYVSPYADPQKQAEEWRFQIALLLDADSGAPSIDFTARQIAIPSHVWDEADRYFAQVTALLGPPKVLVDEQSAPPAAPTAAAPSEIVHPIEEIPASNEPAVDIDEVTPAQAPPVDVPPASPPSALSLPR